MLVQLDRRLFTVTDYQRMIETGILQEGDRCELLNGEIVKMAPIGRKHAAVVNRINKLFSRILQEAIIVCPKPDRAWRVFATGAGYCVAALAR